MAKVQISLIMAAWGNSSERKVRSGSLNHEERKGSRCTMVLLVTMSKKNAKKKKKKPQATNKYMDQRRLMMIVNRRFIAWVKKERRTSVAGGHQEPGSQGASRVSRAAAFDGMIDRTRWKKCHRKT